MANYSAYIPAVGAIDYPTQISNFITISEAIDTEVETARNGESTLLDGINLKLNLSGGTMTGALTISTGGVTLTAGNIIVSGTVDGRDISIDGTKLDAIEALADVTDTTNVTTAGALMDSEVDADIKTLALPANTTISAFGATVVDDADANTVLTTLGLDTDLGSISLPASTTISTFGASLIDDTSATAARATLSAAGTGVTNTFTLTNTFSIIDTKLITETSITATPTTTYTADLSTGSLFQLTMGGNTTISFSNIPITGKSTTVTFVLIQDGTGNRVPAFPASVDWDGGILPTWGTTSGNEDVVTVFTYDGGTKWRGNLVGQNYA